MVRCNGVSTTVATRKNSDAAADKIASTRDGEAA